MLLFSALGVCVCLFFQDSAQEGVITRDIHRTFPAHDYFKDSNGDGQDSLYKICKVSPLPTGQFTPRLHDKIKLLLKGLAIKVNQQSP